MKQKETRGEHLGQRSVLSSDEGEAIAFIRGRLERKGGRLTPRALLDSPVECVPCQASV